MSRQGTSAAKPCPTTPRFYAVIPTYDTLTSAEQVDVDEGGAWPVREFEHLERHESFLDFLIDRGFEAWRRANGGVR